MVNLTIAGGNITAAGTWGNTGGSSGGGASIGTGCAVGSDKTAGTVSGLKITGGNIKAYRMDNSAACIGGGYRSGYVTVDIYGGTITADEILHSNGNTVLQMRAAAIGGGGGGTGSASPAGATVHIHNGKIKASGHYGSAIGSGAGGSSGHGQNATIIIDNGDIAATTTKGNGNGSGAAVGAGGSLGSGYAGNANITINGGKIEASSEMGADIGGGGTNSASSSDYGGKGTVTVTGGEITANTGGIGGGRANKGSGGDAVIAISGASTQITAKSIGGGRSNSNTGGNVQLEVDGGNLTVTDFIGGGIGGTNEDKIGWAKVYINGGQISGRTVMKASTSEGCVFNMTGGTLTSPITSQPGGAVYMVDTKGVATLAGGTVQNCKGTTGGAIYMTGGKFSMTNGKIDNCNGTGSGAIYLEGGTVEISGGTISNCTGSQNGGAVYLAGTGTVNVSGGDITGNKVTGNGGAIYMAGGKFDMTNGKISGCEGKNGGAVYMTGGEFSISGNAVMQGNISNNGGAVYLDGTGTLNITGGTIKGNSADTDGGAVYLTSGTFNMSAGKVEGNISRGGNGAGAYISNGTVTLQGGDVTGNIASEGKGGGFYVAGGAVTLSNGTIDSNKAKTAGGGICIEGNDANNIVSVKVEGCTLTGNEATDGNGGGIFLSNAEMTYSGGLLSLNKATGTMDINAGSTDLTGFEADAGSIKGVGGGIYISTNSKLVFGNFGELGVYANTADMAADDLFANGKNTSLLLPNITKMKLQNYAGNAQGLGWYEDFFVNDSKYTTDNISKGDATKQSFDYRFRVAQEKGNEYMRLYDFTGDSKELKDYYVSLALGFLFSDLTIRVEGLKPGESCIFNVKGKGKYTYQVPVYGTSNQYDEKKITKLPIEEYTVTLMQGWPWAYEQPTESSITKKNSVDEGIYKFTIEHKQSSITHDEKNISIKMN